MWNLREPSFEALLVPRQKVVRSWWLPTPEHGDNDSHGYTLTTATRHKQGPYNHPCTCHYPQHRNITTHAPTCHTVNTGIKPPLHIHSNNNLESSCVAVVSPSYLPTRPWYKHIRGGRSDAALTESTMDLSPLMSDCARLSACLSCGLQQILSIQTWVWTELVPVHRTTRNPPPLFLFNIFAGHRIALAHFNLYIGVLFLVPKTFERVKQGWVFEVLQCEVSI